MGHGMHIWMYMSLSMYLWSGKQCAIQNNDIWINIPKDRKIISASTSSLSQMGDISSCKVLPDSKVHGANMGSIWGREDPGGPHADPMNLATWAGMELSYIYTFIAIVTWIYLSPCSAEAIYDDQADKKFRAGVDHTGDIQWVPGGKFVTSCQLDITLYPFDSQHCEMDFVDWTYDGRFVNLLNGSSKIGMDVYKKHGEWDIVRTEAMKSDQYFVSDPGIPFPTVKFVLHLKRKPRFYMINVVAPCLLMSILALLVFYLPPDSGEKVSLGITVLLSFSVFLLLIAENVPKTSDYVPLIGKTLSANNFTCVLPNIFVNNVLSIYIYII